MNTTAAGGGGIEVVFAVLEAAANTFRQAADTVTDVAGGTAGLRMCARAAGDGRVDSAIDAFLSAWERGAKHLGRDAGALAHNLEAARVRYEGLDAGLARSIDAARG